MIIFFYESILCTGAVSADPEIVGFIIELYRISPYIFIPLMCYA